MSSLIGEEAHIVARNIDGPRGDSSLSISERNSYSNLILLCPNHHAAIDDQPNGPIEYSIERLNRIKREHESWVASLDSFDQAEQLAQEQWAAIVDDLDRLMSWDTWTEDMSQLTSVYQAMPESSFMRLKEASAWMFSRVWPPGHAHLRDTIETMRVVVDDLLNTFNQHIRWPPWHEGFMETESFYKTSYWLPEEQYKKLVAEYEYHASLVEDLSLELTRYGNLLADVIREEIDPSYRFQQGALVIRYGVDILWGYTLMRPEFTASEIDSAKQPYSNLQDFAKTRLTRSNSAIKNGNPRTIAGHQRNPPD